MEQLAPSGRRALVVMAHPDDIEFSCGGTVARWCDEGWEVTFLLATSGDKGSKDPEMTPERLAAIREEEQRAAAAVLGVRHVEFLRCPDGYVEDTVQMRERVVRAIRRFRPDVVVTWDGFRRSFNHRDHRTIGVVTVDAVFPLSRSGLYFPEHLAEGLEPHRTNEVLLAGSDQPDYLVDVSRYVERKIEAALRHESQVLRDRSRDEWLAAARGRAGFVPRGGAPAVEAFRRLRFGRQLA